MRVVQKQMDIISAYFAARAPGFQGVDCIAKHAFLYRYADGWADSGVGGKCYCYRSGDDGAPRLLLFDRHSTRVVDVVPRRAARVERDGKFLIVPQEGGDEHVGLWFDQQADADRIFDLLS